MNPHTKQSGKMVRAHFHLWPEDKKKLVLIANKKHGGNLSEAVRSLINNK